MAHLLCIIWQNNQRNCLHNTWTIFLREQDTVGDSLQKTFRLTFIVCLRCSSNDTVRSTSRVLTTAVHSPYYWMLFIPPLYNYQHQLYPLYHSYQLHPLPVPFFNLIPTSVPFLNQVLTLIKIHVTFLTPSIPLYHAQHQLFTMYHA